MRGSSQGRGIRAFTRKKKARSSPMRPRPMNPHVAKLEGDEEKDRDDVVERERVVEGVWNLQRREGDNRTATDGFMARIESLLRGEESC